MRNFIKKNFVGFEQLLLSLFVLSFFLPNIYQSYRFDHLTIYILTLLYFFNLVIFLFKKKYSISDLKNFLKLNKNSLIFFILASFFIFFVLISLVLGVISENFQTIREAGLVNIKVILSILDNYFQSICIIFLSLIFFLSKEKEKNINVFMSITVLLIAINSFYGLIELFIVLLDENCDIFFSIKQSLSCNLISGVDRQYSGIQFSNAGTDYINRSVVSDQVKNEMLGYVFNSPSIGWISLSAGRSSGILNMPVQGATLAGASIFLLIILYFRNLRENIRYRININYFIVLFFLLLIGSILPASRITSHLIIPGIIVFLFLKRKELKFLIHLKFMKISFIIFLSILIFLGSLRWNGYNNYYTHALRYINIVCEELSINCNFREQIIRERNRVIEKNYLKAKGVDALIQKYNLSGTSEGLHNDDESKILFGYEKINEKQQENTKSFNKFNYYIFYLTGGRYGGHLPVPIDYVIKNKLFFGYGPITKINFDQLHYYLLYNTGLISLILFNLILLFLFFKMITNQKILSPNILLPTIIIYLIYFLASFGGPIYFMNRVTFLFLFMMIFILTEIDKQT